MDGGEPITYSGGMRSKLAEQVRREQRERELAMTPDERMALALSAGRRQVEGYAAHHGLTYEEARQALERAVGRGRRMCSWQKAGG